MPTAALPAIYSWVASTVSVATLSWAAGTVAGVLAVGATVGAAMWGLKKASDALAPDLESYGQSVMDRMLTATTSEEPLNTIYGTARKGGVLVFQDVSNANPTEQDNGHLWQVIAVAGHEIDSWQKVHLKGRNGMVAIDVATEINGSNEVTHADFVDGDGDNLVTIWFHNGSDSQTYDTNLSGAFPGKWTIAHRGRGIAYAVIRYEVDDSEAGNDPDNPDGNVWAAGVPNPTFTIRGKKVRDPRVTPDSTLTWSDNPALCIADALADPLNGLGVDWDNDIDHTALTVAADACEESVTVPNGLGGSTTQERYSCNGIAYSSAAPATSIQHMLSSMAGAMTYANGQFIIHAGEYSTPTLTLDETWLAGKVQAQATAPRADRYNFVQGRFVDSTIDNQQGQYRSRSNSTYETEDGGIRLEKSIDFPFTNDPYEAQRLALIALKKSRNQKTIELICNANAMQVATFDVINVTLDELGYSSKPFRVISWSIGKTGEIVLGLVEESSTDWTYTWSTDLDEVDGPTGTLDPLPEIPPAPTGLTASTVADGVSLEWVSPDPNLHSHIEVYRADTNNRPTGAQTPITKTRGEQYIDPVVAGATKYYWILSRGRDGQTSAWHPTGATSGVAGTGGESSVTASYSTSAGLSWTKAGDGGAWSPATATTDVTFTWKQNAATIATRVVRITRDASGDLTAALEGTPTGDATGHSVYGSGTGALTIEAAHTDSGVTIAVSALTAISGDSGALSASYYIKPTNGTAIKNGSGTLTIEARKVDGTGDNLLAAGDIKLYGPGDALLGDGYSATLDTDDITGDIVVTLQDISVSPDVVYDSITLVDVDDGATGAVGADAIYGYIESEQNVLAWVKAEDGGAWSPSDTWVDMEVTFVQGGVDVAREARRINRSATGVFSDGGAQTHSGGDLNVSRVAFGLDFSGTAATVTCTYTQDGETCVVHERLAAVLGGSAGSTGPQGDPGDDAVNYYIKPTNGTAIHNGTGTLTIEAHKVTGTGDVLLSSGTIQLYDESNDLVTVANGYATGSDGYTGVLDSGDISGDIVITMKDGVGGTALDTITLVDIADGATGATGGDGEDAAYGYVEADYAGTPSASPGTLAWVKAANGGAWSPSDTYTDLNFTVVRGGSVIYRDGRRITLNNGALSIASVPHWNGNLNTGDATITSVGGGTGQMTVKCEFDDGTSSVTFAETVTATVGGDTGAAAFTIVLTNAADTIACDSDGTPISGAYDGTGTDISVWYGTQQCPYDSSSPYQQPSFRVTTIDSPDINQGTGSTPSTYVRRYADASSINADTAYIQFNITAVDDQGNEYQFTPRQTFSKVYGGADGTGDPTHHQAGYIGGSATDVTTAPTSAFPLELEIKTNSNTAPTNLQMNMKHGTGGGGDAELFAYELEILDPACTVTGFSDNSSEATWTNHGGALDFSTFLTTTQETGRWGTNGVMVHESIAASSTNADKFTLTLSGCSPETAFRVKFRRMTNNGGDNEAYVSIGNRFAHSIPEISSLDAEWFSFTFDLTRIGSIAYADDLDEAATLTGGIANANVVGLGDLALLNDVNLQTDVTGTLPTGNAASGLINTNITYNSDGTLSGAGGGTAPNLADIAGAIDGAQVAENSIAARHMIITDFENLFGDGSLETATTAEWVFNHSENYLYTTSSTYIRNGLQSIRLGRNDGLTSTGYRKNFLKVTEGEEFYFEGWMKMSGGTDGDVQFYRIYYDGDKASVGGGSIVPTGTLTTSWSKFYGTLTIPANVEYLRIGVRRTASTTGAIYYDDLICRRMKGGELIVDGAISADKIGANAVTAGKIEAGAVVAEKIAANAVALNNLHVTSWNYVNDPQYTDNTSSWGGYDASNVLRAGYPTSSGSLSYNSTYDALALLTNNYDRHVSSDTFPVNHNKIYKVNCRYLSNNTNGNVHFGPAAWTTWKSGDVSGGNGQGDRDFQLWNTSRNQVYSAETNVYAVSNEAASTSWQEREFYLIGNYRELDECPAPVTGKVPTYPYMRFADNTAKYCQLRLLNWSGTSSTTRYLTDVSVTEIDGGEIVAENIQADTITANEIAGSTITANEIAASTITGSKIAGDTIVGNNIAARTLSAENMQVTAFNKVGDPTHSGNISGWAGYDHAGNVIGTTHGNITYSSSERAIACTTSSTHGFNSMSWPVNHNKIYKITWEARKNSTGGRHLVGVTAATTPMTGHGNSSSALPNGDTLTHTGYEEDKVTTSTHSNLYLVSQGDNTAWETWEGYFIGANRSVDECPAITDNGRLSDYGHPYIVLDSGTRHVGIRCLNWDNTATTTMYVRNISVTDIGAGKLSATQIVAGTITGDHISSNTSYTGDLEIKTSGKIWSGKSTYGSSTLGWWIGEDSSKPKMHIGDSTKFLKFDGDDVIIGGDLIATGNINANAVTLDSAVYTAGSILVDTAIGSKTTIQTLSSFASGGDDVILICTCLGTNFATSNFWPLYRDSESNQLWINGVTFATAGPGTVSFIVKDTGATGTHNYIWKGYVGSAGNGGYARNRSIVAFRYKR